MVTAREEVLGNMKTTGEPGASCAGDALVRVGKRRRHPSCSGSLERVLLWVRGLNWVKSGVTPFRTGGNTHGSRGEGRHGGRRPPAPGDCGQLVPAVGQSQRSPGSEPSAPKPVFLLLSYL